MYSSLLFFYTFFVSISGDLMLLELRHHHDVLLVLGQQQAFALKKTPYETASDPFFFNKPRLF